VSAFVTRSRATFSEAGTDIRTIQQLQGHRDVAITMVYLHVAVTGSRKVVSPLDRAD
jgi:site-specific recombinase XerD